MAVNTEVTRTGAESSLSVIRKFTRRMQGTGIIKAVRGRRYFSRATSEAAKKKSALKRIARGTEIKKLIKEGKLNPTERNSRANSRPAPAVTPKPQQ